MTSDLENRPGGSTYGGAARAVHNSFFLISSQLASKLLSFGGVVLLARLLDVADFGLLSLALAVTGIIAIVTELGLDQLCVREIARNHARIPQLLANALLIKISLSTTALLMAALVLTVSGMPWRSETIFLIFMAALVPTGIYHSLVTVFMGIERMGYAALCNTGTELIRLALAAVVLLSGYGLTALAWSYVAAFTFAMILAFLVMRARLGPMRLRPHLSGLLRMARASVPFMFFGLFFVIYFKIDFIMLGAFRGDAETGTYAVAYRLMESLLFIPAALMGAVYPGLSRLFLGGRKPVLAAARNTFRYLAMIGIPLGFGTTVLAGRIVPFLFGETYTASVLPLQILIWAMTLIFLNCICPAGLNAVNRQHYTVLVTGAGVAVNIGLNLFLIPAYGASGASISTLVTEVVTTGSYLLLFSSHVGRLSPVRYSLRPIAASAAMALALSSLYFLPLGLLVMTGVAVYSGALIMLGALGRSDLELLAAATRPPA